MDTLLDTARLNPGEVLKHIAGKSKESAPKSLKATVELTDEQLEEELARRKLDNEQEKLDSNRS